METEKHQRRISDVRKGKGGVGGEGAIVEMVEGVSDCKVQRPFSSLKESILLVQGIPPTLLFFFLITCMVAGLLLCSYDFTYKGNSLDILRCLETLKAVKEALFSFSFPPLH